MTKIIFPYFLFPINKDSENQKSEYLPMVEVKISYNHQTSPQSIQAIFDSGSNINLFHSIFGEQLGIKVKKGKLIKIKGIGNMELNAYAHDVSLKIGKLVIPTKIYFSEYQNFRQIIGTCIFRYFNRIIFHELKKTLILEK